MTWRDEDWAEIGEPSRRHVETWAPERVLAECEAKRRIVEMWSARNEQAGHPTIAAHATGLGLAIRALAVVYADHPDYDEAWRP